jgi:hypothetical protein
MYFYKLMLLNVQILEMKGTHSQGDLTNLLSRQESLY